ncbi:MAG TPA: YqzL family protein [Bacillota bacterium]|nr:YqzL family protein [Bacillota bacterium]
MLDLTWNVFRETGNINAYLLFKTLQSQHKGQTNHSQPDKHLSTHIVNKKG